jgi:uncharacterized membrane protein YkvI
MNGNREIIIKAIIIAVFYGAVTTVILNIFTAAYTASMPGDSNIETITGIRAIKLQIETFGFAQFLVSLFPWYTVMVSVILGGCLLHAYWLRSNSNKSA